MIARSLAIGLLLLSVPAAAAPIDDAKKAFAEGKAAFERGDYEAALAGYQKANMILPAPNLYYNIGATYERLGRYQEAALAFDKYFEMAGTPTTDEEKQFQEKLHARAEADRHRADLPPKPATPPPAQQQQQPPPTMPPPAPGAPTVAPYYMAPYAYAPQQPTREMRLKDAHARRSRAIALMAVGVPLSVAGIIGLGIAFDGSYDVATQWGIGFLGFTGLVVGTTLWAPGAASFVRSSKEIKELSRPQPLPPPARGF